MKLGFEPAYARLAVAALLLATAVAAQAKCTFKRIATIPIEWRDDRLTLDGSINGTPLRMAVDTGAMQTVVSGALVDSGAPASLLDAAVARSLGFHPEDPALLVGSMFGIGEHESPVSVITLDSVAIGPEIVRKARIEVADMWASLRADTLPSERGDFLADREHMILGADFIRAHHLLFANSQRRLYFSYLGGDVFRAPKPQAAVAAPASAP